MKDSIKQEVIQLIKNVFTDEKLKYTYDDEANLFLLGFDLDCMVDTAKLLIFVDDIFYVAYATTNLTVTSNWPEVYEYIARANSNLINGNFEINPKNGSIRYKICVDFCDAVPSPKTIKRTVHYAVGTLERYIDGLLKVMVGSKTAASAIEEIENNDKETE